VRPFRAVVVLTLLSLLLAGCASQKGRFDRVNTGMSRREVTQRLGRPTDASLSVLHWQSGDYTDAWVFFDSSGGAVTGKYWQDRESLRLDEIRPRLE
jgi:hypothetical protein